MTDGTASQSETASGNQLLADYAATGSETAFRELVGRYVDLVYSAAVRLVNGDSHRAEDVTQTVFADLARKARSLSREVMLGGWLHWHTVFVASKIMRGERRRQLRERQAVEMNELEDYSAANLAMVSPVLDDAINQLGAEDRAAIMLRFFEQRDFRSVGEAMGGTEEAARKRVDRALGKLELLLKRRGVALSAAALGTTLGTSAVSAAPAGLATGVATAALASAAAAVGGGTALTIIKIMTITKAKAAIIGAIVVAAVAAPLVISHQKEAAKLRAENEALSKQQAQEIQQLQDEKDDLLKQAGRANAVAGAQRSTNDLSREVLRLRGEVGKLRQEKEELAASRANGPSALSALRQDPEMWKVLRDQQKKGMGFMYKEFAEKAKLSKEQKEKLNDVLADDIMESIDRVTEVLKDGKTGKELDDVFTAQEAALAEKVEGLLGQEGFSQYKEYTQDLASYLTGIQFGEKLTGDKSAKDEKIKQLRQLMQEETQAALAGAGLPPDFQTVPILNFRNIASEAEAEKNLKLLDNIYERVGARAGSFLTVEELEKLKEFRTAALKMNQMSLAMNRKMMAPGGK